MVKTIVVDTFFVSTGPVATGPCAELIKSWDGSMYAETNIIEVAGPGRFLISRGRNEIATLAGFDLCHPIVL